MRAMVSEVPLCRRSDSNEVAVVLLKTLSKYSRFSSKLSCESQTSCARLVRVRTVNALCEVGL